MLSIFKLSNLGDYKSVFEAFLSFVFSKYDNGIWLNTDCNLI